MQKTGSRRFTFLFDLDGVLVDNIEFERKTTCRISAILSEKRGISSDESEALWDRTLREQKDTPYWHDYAHHCRLLEIPDAWRQAHIESAESLRTVVGAHEAIAAASKLGGVWLVSDATEWVIEFKLKCVGFDMQQFGEIFCLDRCRCSKRQPQYWQQLVQAASGPCVYIDNRRDLLDYASSQMEFDHLFWLQFDDHPMSLDIWTHKHLNDGVEIIPVRPGELASNILGLI